MNRPLIITLRRRDNFQNLFLNNFEVWSQKLSFFGYDFLYRKWKNIFLSSSKIWPEMERKSYRKSFQGSFLKISCQNGSSIGDEKESRRVIVSLALMFVLLKELIINNLFVFTVGMTRLVWFWVVRSSPIIKCLLFQ